MLEHSFIHLPGVGGQTERRLWSAGLTRWDDLDASAPLAGLSLRRLSTLRALLDESADRLAAADAGFFADRLPPAEAWRLFANFAADAAYLDIETTGMDAWSQITTAVVHRGGRTHFFVRDENLHELPMHLAGAKLLVTYNGKCFDWPILRAHFARLPAPPAHLDLRYPFARLGFRGGLKAIEPAVGLRRPSELEGIDGFAAVWLWRRHLDGDARALPSILRYNAEDVLNLKYLAEWVYNRLAGEAPVDARLFARPQPAACDALPAADAELLAECRAALANPAW